MKFGLLPLLAGVVALAPVHAYAQARVTLDVSAQKLTTEDELRITVRATGSYDQMSTLTVEGFELQSAGHQQQLSVIGSQMQQSESQMYVGTPQKPGKFTLGPVHLLQDGKVVASSAAVTVEVTGVQETHNVQPPEKATDLSAYVGQAFFVHPTLTTNHPFVGQPFVVSYALYWSRQRSVAGIRPTADPHYDKLEPENLLENGMERAESLTLSGHPYQRQVTHRDLLVAATPGTLLLEGPRFRVDTLDARAQKVTSPVMEVHVRPVPTEGRPPGFQDNQVGRLQIAGTLQAAGTAIRSAQVLDVRTGDRVLLAVTVSGDGNLLGLRPPELPQLPGMTAELLPTRDDVGVKKTQNGMQGKKTWQWMLTFNQPGKVEIPAIPWTSFDPYTEKFEAQAIGPFSVNVQGAALAQAVTTADELQEGPKPAVAAKNQLRPLAKEAGIAVTDRSDWTRGNVLKLLLILPWLLAAGILGLWWKRRRDNAAAPERARTQALPQARKRLELAKTLEPGQGYAELRKIVADFLQTAAEVGIAGLTEQAMVETLVARKVPADVARDLAADVQHCDFARFAPAGDRQTDLGQTADRIGQHLAKVDPALTRMPQNPPRKLLILLLILTAGLSAQKTQAATLDETFHAANQAYEQGDYPAARRLYESLLEHDLRVPAVRYNLGNTFVQLQQPGRAVAQFQAALQMGPEPTLRANILNNLNAVRAELRDRARRHHATLHVFDESAGLDVLVAEAIPRQPVAVLAVLAGWLAAGLLGLRLLKNRRQTGLLVALGTGAVVHIAGVGLLAWSAQMREAVTLAVVVDEDALLTTCAGPGEQDDLGLPEGLEVRRLGEMADGRVQVRLPNGREGCLQPKSLEVEPGLGR